MTVKQLLDAVFRLFDIRTPTPEEYDAGMSALNLFLQELAISPQGVQRLFREAFNTVAGTASYAIGTGQTWNTSRPTTIQEAFIRIDTTDYPVQTYQSMQNYAGLPDKSLQTRPERLYYEPEAAYGTVLLYPVPDVVYALHLYSQKPFTAYTNTAIALGLAPEYEPMLKWNMAIEMAPELGTDATAIMGVRARATTRAFKNLHSHPVPKIATNPFGHGGRSYDITGDRYA